MVTTIILLFFLFLQYKEMLNPQIFLALDGMLTCPLILTVSIFKRVFITSNYFFISGYSVSKIAVNKLTALHAKKLQSDPRPGILANCVRRLLKYLFVIIFLSIIIYEGRIIILVIL